MFSFNETYSFVPVIKMDTRNLAPYTQESSMDESYIAPSAMKNTNNFLKLASTPITKSNKGGPVFGEVSPINNSFLSKSAINSSSELYKVDSFSLPEVLEVNPIIKQVANFPPSMILVRRTYDSTDSMKFSSVQMNSLHKFMNSSNSKDKYELSDSNLFRETRSSLVVCQSSPLSLSNSNKDNFPETNAITRELNVPCKTLPSKTNNIFNTSTDSIDSELQVCDNKENDRLRIKNSDKKTELENRIRKRIRKRNPKYDSIMGEINSKPKLNEKKLKKSKLTCSTNEVASLKTVDCALNVGESNVITRHLKNVSQKGKKRKNKSEVNEILPIKKRNYMNLQSKDSDNLLSLRKSNEQSNLMEFSVDNVGSHKQCLDNFSSSANDLLGSIDNKRNSAIDNFVTLRKSNEITKSKEEYVSTRTLNPLQDKELSYFVTQRKSKEKKYSTDVMESNAVNIINIDPTEASASCKKYASISRRENFSHIIRETNDENENNSFQNGEDQRMSIHNANPKSSYNLNATGSTGKEVYNNSMEDNKIHNLKDNKTNSLEKIEVYNSTISDENGTIYVIADDLVSSRVKSRTRFRSSYNTNSRNAGRSRREKYDNSKIEGYTNESRGNVQSEDMSSSSTNSDNENISRLDKQRTKASVRNSKNSVSKNIRCENDKRKLEKFASTTTLSIAAISPGVQSKKPNNEPKVKFMISPNYNRYSRKSILNKLGENSHKNVSLEYLTGKSAYSVIEPNAAQSAKISQTKRVDKQDEHSEKNVIITIDSTLETSTLEKIRKHNISPRDSENICTKTTIRKSKRLKELKTSTFTIDDEDTPPRKKLQILRKTNSIRLSLLPKNCVGRKSTKSYPIETSGITEKNQNSSQNHSLEFNTSRKVIRPGNWRRSLAAWKSNRISRRCIILVINNCISNEF